MGSWGGAFEENKSVSIGGPRMSPDINRVIESIPRVAIDKAPGGIPWGQVDMEEYKNPFSTHFH